MISRKLLTAAVLLLLPLLVNAQTEWVNPFIGTDNYGACNPGAVTPNALMSVSPFNVMGSELNTWDKDSRWWSTPYVAENRYFTGFSHVNLSGVGCPDAAALLTMPTRGTLQVDYHIYGCEYTEEKASPGYYSNFLSNGVRTEASATTRTSIERYTFPEGPANILLNLGEGLTNESGAMVRRVSDTEIEGFKLQGNFCYNRAAVYTLYFVLRISKAADRDGYWKKQRPMTAEAVWDRDAGGYRLYDMYTDELAGDDIGYWFSYDHMAPGEQVCVQMGVSLVSIDNARRNLYAEQTGFDFDRVRKEADASWKEHLEKVRLEGGTDDQKTVFYTALYHTLIHPSIINDVNGQYPLMEHGRLRSGKVGMVTKGNRYSVFSLWDTCRNLHQLMTLLYPEKQADMLRSIVDMYQEWGWLPRWELFGRETFSMEGDPAIPVIVDSWYKGLRDFPVEKAYEAMVKSANTAGKDNIIRPDIDPYINKGYIPLGFFSSDFTRDNSVSHALEYYMADAALARFALALGKADDAKKYLARSKGYKNYYSKEYGCFRPLLQSGSFLTPFDPMLGKNFEPAPGFHEGCAWNYTFYVPHDVEGLSDLMGGDKEFVSKLQMVFDEGLYDPSNEPDIAYPYLFSRFKGEEWRTWKIVHSLLGKYYRNAPDGLPGNDDTGTLSAWAVFSMMGFYPDCPGDPYFTITVPAFDKVTIDLQGGKKLVVSKEAAADFAIQAQSQAMSKACSARIGGKKVKSYRISNKDLMSAGSIVWK
ncbi:MAG: GH92 family glycosyl hydrolase [Bacteroidales bacterium]|nr:GH92 family glycosyl hydrolase [Bacteroidales bacterium]